LNQFFCFVLFFLSLIFICLSFYSSSAARRHLVKALPVKKYDESHLFSWILLLLAWPPSTPPLAPHVVTSKGGTRGEKMKHKKEQDG
jgi:hypothetical protein